MSKDEFFVKGYFRELHIHHEWCDVDEVIKSTAKIGLSADYKSSATEILLLTGTESIHLDELDSGRLCCLRVADVSDRGMERVRYEVHDIDQGGLFLECSSVIRNQIST